ncbi:hypothetical protein [Chryseobacterium indoltheticum]
MVTYTDWVIGHVHLGALGWNGFMAFGVSLLFGTDYVENQNVVCKIS